ncbi:MAG TPA: enoyl-CoA hydratase-related protein [Ferruginibacter sp.]|nr:enoyl-CoA hydratase-related protein [Ferruginibacter sp.]
MYEMLITSLDQGIFTITINRPDKLNALNKTVMEELSKAIDTIYSDEEIKCAIITGSGAKAFVAGADIGGFLQLDPGQGKDFAKEGHAIFNRIEQCNKPVIAAVNGFALGGGCELAMACHFRLASTNAKFGLPEVNLGLIPGYGGTQRLAQLVGKGKAMELVMTASMIDANEALRLGLVNHITAQEVLLEECKKILTVILSKGPSAVGKAIAAINANFDTTKNGFEEEIRLFGECFSGNEMKEGVNAFLEKRTPQFHKPA